MCIKTAIERWGKYSDDYYQDCKVRDRFIDNNGKYFQIITISCLNFPMYALLNVTSKTNDKTYLYLTLEALMYDINPNRFHKIDSEESRSDTVFCEPCLFVCASCDKQCTIIINPWEK